MQVVSSLHLRRNPAFVLRIPPSCQTSASWQALSWCELRAEQAVVRRTANPERGTERTVWLADLAVVLRPVSYPGLTVTLSLDNLWDQADEPLVGVEAPGRRASVSLAYAW